MSHLRQEGNKMQTSNLVLLSNQEALERAMDVVANNIANSSTAGFKREGIQFNTLINQPAPGESIDFVIDKATYHDVSSGPTIATGNPLDVAIRGAGYFPVQTPAGTRYTRGGSFQLNDQGEIVTAAGQLVLGDGDQPITLPDTTTNITISPDGVVSAQVDNSPDTSQVGKLKLVTFDNEQDLQPEGSGLYSTSQPALPATNPQIMEATLEQSNVQPVTEITHMIEILRSYEQTQNLINAENTRMSDGLTKLSRVSAA